MLVNDITPDFAVGIMFTEEMIKKVSGLFTIVEAIEKTCKKKNIEKKSLQGELALYFRDPDENYILCFGLWYELWLRYQNPLWFGVDLGWTRQVVSRFTKRHTGDFLEYNNYRLCPIGENVMTGQNCVEGIVEILEKELKGATESSPGNPG